MRTECFIEFGVEFEEIENELNKDAGDVEIKYIDGRLVASFLTYALDGEKYIEIELSRDRPDDIATSIQRDSWGSIKQGVLSK